MKGRTLCVARTSLAVIILLVCLLTGSAALACKFWGMVSAPNFGADPVLYNSTLDTWLSLSIAPPPPFLNSPNGWATVWYHPGASGGEQVGIVREQPTITVDAFQPVRDQMLSDMTYAAIAHTRRASSGQSNIPDNHPFVYTGPSGLFGKTWSLAHNGTIYSPAVIEDSLGTGFISLPIFQDTARHYTAWNAGTANRNDSEYYGMLLMKYLMAANSYYYTAPASIGSPTEWAINQTIAKIVSSSTYSAVNSVLTDGQEMWAMFRKSAPLDDNHFVSYYSDPANPAHKLAMTTLTPLEGWTNFTNATHGSYGQYACLRPNENAMSEIFQPSVMANPNELRINEAAQSNLSQQRPAVSANPFDASFVVVWETTDGNHIKARWLNPMGMAERGEFAVDETADGVKGLPNVAHNPVDGSMTVVWKERRDFGFSNLVKARRFTWSLANRAWMGQAETIVNGDVSCEIERPKVAYDNSGNCLVMWTMNPAAQPSVWIKAFLADGTVGPDVRITPADANGYIATDLHYLGRGRFGMVYAGTSQNSRGVYVALYETATGAVSAPKQIASMTTVANSAAAMPSIDAVNDSVFVAAYWTQSAAQITGKVLRHAAGLNAALVTQRTDVLSSVGPDQPYVQVAARSDSRYYVCFQKAASGRFGIYCAQNQSKRNFLTPEPIHATATGNRCYPAIALSRQYSAEYLTHSTTDIFNQRRLIVWQTDNQDGSEWGISGRFHGISGDNKYPWYARDVYNESAARGFAENPPQEIPVPTSEILLSSYPNPFNAQAMIRFTLPEDMRVDLAVYDINGRLVRRLSEGTVPAGEHELRWDASGLPSGVYFARIEAGALSRVHKMVLLK